MQDTCHSGKWKEDEVRGKVSVNMKLQDGQTVKLTQVLYLPQAVENLLIVKTLISKGSTMRATQDKMIVKKNGVGMILDARKGKKKHDVLLEVKQL